TWVPAQLTDAEKRDAANYEPGDMIQFHQNAPGYTKGSRLVVGEGSVLPLQFVNRFEVYRPAARQVAIGDRIRSTVGSKTKNEKRGMANGALLTVEGFTRRGDLIVDHGWVIDQEFGHIDHGIAMTSYAVQGKTVHKVFVGVSSDSFPATNQRSFYVPMTRGK